MSQLLQSGHHPDADQLNDFVEHALPSHERDETLAHLALCPDCRAIVALSLPLVEETLPQPEPLRRPLFPGWFAGRRLLWPLAAAAALAIFGVSVHLRNASPGPPAPAAPQVAVNHAPPPPIAPERPQPATPRQRASDSPRQELPVTQKAFAPEPAKPLEPQEIAALPMEGREVASRSTLPPPAPKSGHASAQAAGAAASTDTLSANGAAVPLGQEAAKRPLQATSAVRSAAVAGLVPENFSAASGTPAVESKATTPFMLQAAKPASYGRAVPEPAQAILRIHPLPSGLAALSIATDARQGRTLAVDIHGALFLTSDFGEHWTRVAAQWPGRAVKIDLAYSGSVRRYAFMASGAIKMSPQPAQVANAEVTPASGSVGGPVAKSAVTSSVIPSGVQPSSLGGTVTDTTGAIIPGATVIVSASPTQLARMVKADATGHYLIEGLAPDTYTVEAGSPGFMQQRLTGVAIAPGKPALANLTLSVGAGAQTVMVNAAAAPLELDEPTVKKSEAKVKAPARATAVPAAPPAAVPAAVPVAVPAAPAFEITTETGQQWVSPDGLIWKRK